LEEERLHREIGAKAAGLVDGLVAVGARGRWIAEGARATGLPRVSTAPDATEAVSMVERDLMPGVGDLLLVKGSRGVELDRLVAAIAPGPDRAEAHRS
jgi:UDP-N-acetylmuramoyl-tripeptide--D-alanyl-D-alanine ligase